MNIAKRIMTGTTCLLLGIITVSCALEDFIPSDYKLCPCRDINHYNYWAGDCVGEVVLQREQQEALDTLTKCVVSFGNYASKNFVVSDFPVRLFSYLLEDSLQYHDIVDQCPDRKELSFVYELFEDTDTNDMDNKSKAHTHYTKISGEHKEFIDVTMNNSRCRLVFEGEPLISFNISNIYYYYDGVSLELINVIDMETNDTIKISSSDTDIKLVVRPRCKETFF